MFEKNLQDLVKGIRSTKGDVNVYISQCMQEIKNELKSTDQSIKAQAVRKLTYLHMLGYDMCWAAFHVVEVMSYERFAHKRIGYNAACQSFTQSTDVVLLCTNLLKKEFSSPSEYEVGLAINVLANIVTTDLARDLLGDVVAMLNSPKSYVRKKATLVLYKMYLRYPQGLRLTFDKLKERMEEPDVSVVSCAVNVICELAKKKPKNYLGLAPQFFRLLTTSSNNWMLIKVVKLMKSLVPEEPRLARKLLDPLATIIQNTPAKSLLYECISTVTTALLYTKKSDGAQPRNVPAVVRLCNDHLRRYIEDPDQNLRYLGLVGLSNLMQSHPYVITEHQELIVECLAVDDITIRMRSLELLAGMVNPDNAAQIIRELMRQTLSADGTYRHELITRILHVCSVNKYENVHDFDWYIHVLVQLARIPSHQTMTDELEDSLTSTAVLQSRAHGSSASEGASGSSGSNAASTSGQATLLDHLRSQSHGIEVARQLVDIAVRVKSVRSVMVDHMMELLMEKEALSGPGAGTLSQVFFAAAWIAGEYMVEYLDDDESEDDEEDEDEERETEGKKLERLHELVDQMMQPRTTTLPAGVQSVYVHTLLKFVMVMAERAEEDAVEQLVHVILERLPAFTQSEYIEVQERALCVQQVLIAMGLGISALSSQERAAYAFDHGPSVAPEKRLEILNAYFAERLAPVGARAQRKVPLPAGLDLDDPMDDEEASFLESGGDVAASFANEDDLEVSFVQQGSSYASAPSLAQKSPFQGSDESSSEAESESDGERERSAALERERLRTDPFYLSGSNKGPGGKGSSRDGKDNGSNDFAEIFDAFEATKNKKKKRKESKKTKKARAVFEDELMPEGARSSDEERRRSKRKSRNEDMDLSAIDLTTPLGDDERIPDDHLFHRQALSSSATEGPTKDKKKKKKKKSTRSDDDEEPSKRHSKKTKKKSRSSSKAQDDDAKEGFLSSRSRAKESKENVYGNSPIDDDRRDRRSSKKSRKTSSSSSKREKDKDKRSSSSALKEKKKEKRSSKSSKSSSANVQKDQPLLLF